jgi:hypothetical protein
VQKLRAGPGAETWRMRSAGREAFHDGRSLSHPARQSSQVPRMVLQVCLMYSRMPDLVDESSFDVGSLCVAGSSDARGACLAGPRVMEGGGSSIMGVRVDLKSREHRPHPKCSDACHRTSAAFGLDVFVLTVDIHAELKSHLLLPGALEYQVVYFWRSRGHLMLSLT